MLNLGQISYESFFCRPNGSQLKLSPKITQLNFPLRVVVTILECCVTFSGVKLSIRSFVLFSYFAKIPPWLEIGGRKNQPHAKG